MKTEKYVITWNTGVVTSTTVKDKVGPELTLIHSKIFHAKCHDDIHMILLNFVVLVWIYY